MLRALIFGILLLTACEDKLSTDRLPHEATYLALGDSYTQGTNLSHGESWPFQLVGYLRNRNINFQDPDVIANFGWTTKELMSAIESRTMGLSYEIVSLCIGVNNQFFQYGLDNYRSDISLLLDRAIALAAGQAENVFVLSIPDYSVTPFARDYDTVRIAQELIEFNKIKKEECNKRNILFIDITGLSREVQGHPEFLLDNGLQLTSESYKKWAEYLGPIIADWYH